MKQVVLIFALAMIGLTSCKEEHCYKCTARVTIQGQTSTSTSTVCVTGGRSEAVDKVRSQQSGNGYSVSVDCK